MLKIVNYTNKTLEVMFDSEKYTFEPAEVNALPSEVAIWFLSHCGYAICEARELKNMRAVYVEETKDLVEPPPNKPPRYMTKPELLYYLRITKQIQDAKPGMSYERLIQMAESAGVLKPLSFDEAQAMLKVEEPTPVAPPAVKPVQLKPLEMPKEA